MIKNQSNIYRFPMEDHLGKGVTGLAPTIKLSKDGGTFAAATNSVTEPDTTNAPGLYQLILTAEECNCNLLTLVVNVPTGEWGAILTEFDMQSPSDTSGLATAEALSAVATNVSAVKAKTDNLPASPAAVGSAMTLTEATVSTVRNNLATVSTIEAAVVSLSSGLDTLASYGDAHWTTAAGFATPSDVAAAVEAIVAALPSDYAKATDVSSAQTALTALINSVLSGIFHWQVEGSILTIYNASNVAIGAYTLTKDSSGNITAVTPIVQPEPETNNAE